MRFLVRRRVQYPSDPCACGHTREDHTHYRPGSDCGTCGDTACASFTAGSEFQVIVDSQPQGNRSQTA